MDYEENRKELANHMVNIEFHPIDSELAIRSDNSISFSIEDLAAYSGSAASVFAGPAGNFGIRPANISGRAALSMRIPKWRKRNVGPKRWDFTRSHNEW